MFICKFDTTSDAFGDPDNNEDLPEIARVLRAMAHEIDVNQNCADAIRDFNGNTIGKYVCTQGDTEANLDD